MRITTLRIVVVFALLVAACAGGEADTTTTEAVADAPPATSAPTSTSQAPAAPGQSDDFCGFLVQYADGLAEQTNVISMVPAEIEALFRSNLDAINQAAQLAPGALEDDVELFAVAFGGFVDFLDEYGFDFMAMDEAAQTDPRMQALDDPALEEAGNRIEEYCGIDGVIASAPSAPAAGGGVTQIPGGEVPDSFPSELILPDGVVVAVVAVGGGSSVTFDTTLPVDDVIDYYVDLLGDPVQEMEAPRGAFWTVVYQGSALSLVVAEIDDDQVQVNVTR